jgi:hypothetical protein
LCSTAFLAKFFPIGKTNALWGIFSWSMGVLSGLHFRLPTSWNWKLVALVDLLPRALYQHPWNDGCCSWRCFPVPYTYSSY